MPDDKAYPPERLVPYDPAWCARAADVSRSLARALGPGWLIEHVGSTSVPGLVAKPVIDLAVGAPEGEDLCALADVLDGSGWHGPVETGDHEALFLHERGHRSAIAHVFTADQWPSAHVRLFAAWLRAHPTDRDRYAALKRGLVEQGIWGGDYTRRKRAFVEDVVNRARSARGLSPVALEGA